MSGCGTCKESTWATSTGCGSEGTADWQDSCIELITEREDLYNTYPWVDWNSANLDVLFDGCDKKIADVGHWVVNCSEDGGARGLYQGYDFNWYNVTPGDTIYISEGSLGTTSNLKALSTDLYKLIAFTDFRIRIAEFYDCGYRLYARDIPIRDSVNGGFQDVSIEPDPPVIYNDITQPGAGMTIQWSLQVWTLQGTPCDNPVLSGSRSTFTFQQSTTPGTDYDWDYFVADGHTKLYDLDNNRYKDSDKTYTHTDLPWDPLVDQA